jgi:two-component system nitrate/nitrite response regulator NarL
MRIVIVDDHPIVRKGLEQVFMLEKDFEVVGTAASCKEGKEMILRQKPQIAIIDLKMPDGSGFELIGSLQKCITGCRYVVLTSYASDNYVSNAVSAKVDGYILKEALPEELINAVRIVAKGRRYYDPGVMNSILNAKTKDSFNGLTNREQDILCALAEGLSNKAIAKKLFITENTVKKHVGNILAKLDLHDRTQAALYAFSEGINQKLGRERAI